MRHVQFVLAAALLASRAAVQAQSALDWTHYVRIAGHSLSNENVVATIRESEQTGVFGIEVDNDIPGRYESFLDPSDKLRAIRSIAEAAHRAHNKAFVYIAGLECITAKADRQAHTFYKDHPDWVQRDRNGKPAAFGGGTAFWISPGDEDVWISPFAKEWRTRYMSLVREIAKTGIDGVYVDIPYWMTHFKGWEHTWASFDRYTVQAFRLKTGIDPMKDMRLGDASDPNFRRWIDFRIDAISDFMREIKENVKAANPNCLTIAEIYPGTESAVPQVGADVYELYKVVDVIAHEYQGPGDSIGASHSAYDWLDQMIGMFTFRSFAGSKASWMLNYSWDGEKEVNIPDAMKTLFASHITAGTNTWDAKGHVMSGSNNPEIRRNVFQWIARNEHTFYDTREPIDPVGVYFSPETRNYYVDAFIPEFKGALFVLALNHREFQIVTPDSLNSFRGRDLIVPLPSKMRPQELEQVRGLKARGIHVIESKGEFGHFQSLLSEKYAGAAGRGTSDPSIQDQITKIAAEWRSEDRVTVKSSPFVIAQIASVHNQPYVYLMNLKGLIAKRNLRPSAESETIIDFAGPKDARVFGLPFLGAVSELQSEWVSGKIHVRVPRFDRSSVIWIEPKKSPGPR